MRCGVVLVAALTVMTATGARADGWCGYAAHEKSIIECGYSSATECETAIGKGGLCFVDPDYALDATRAAPEIATPAITPKLTAGRG